MSSQRPPSDGINMALQKVCAALFVTTQPLSRDQLSDIAGLEPESMDRLLSDAAKKLEPLGILLVQDESGVMATLSHDVRKDLTRYFSSHAPALSSAAMEVLTIVAYNQPVSKHAIDEIRGVVSDASIKTLLTRGLIRADRAKVAEPSYVTTPQFLSLVGLRSIDELPKVAGVKRATQ